MRLTKFSDYSLRILMLSASKADVRITIEEAAETFGISRAHVKKVVLRLSQAGFLTGVRGRKGGFTLAMPPEQINLGALLRVTEPDFGLAECFLTGNQCLITQPCRLPPILNKAVNAFLAVFDAYTVADIMIAPADFEALVGDLQPLRGPRLKPAPDMA
ncbi:transcriptional regulator, BadM/Rrf2 family [Salinihabitans flavidus]|uniref:Transcriptional regulator, BadM/Rrf2 family n=1 Tax=Salinihabitans flavidus TaxID=569882 RepID=A0A1H8S1K9_9RHOB|nr:Rrf2 family transcriptional regulator [Salinihabitans flavidus]SEO72063.1 transcriptional regulator, BadM/Rrf2 family [Salinihabitans flavidus]